VEEDIVRQPLLASENWKNFFLYGVKTSAVCSSIGHKARNGQTDGQNFGTQDCARMRRAVNSEYSREDVEIIMEGMKTVR